MRVYLAGAIHGMNDYQAKTWREEAKRLRPDIEWVNPMARDYRGKEDANFEAIVEGDKADILSCDALLVSAENPSWGTPMEIHFAHSNGKRIIAFRWKPDVSPWLRYHATVVRSMTEALALL